MGTDDDHWISAVDLRAMLWHHLGIGSEDAAARLRPKLRAGLVRCCATAIVQFESEVVWKDWLVPQKIWSTDGALQLDLDHACWKLVEGRPVTPELSSACELELTRMRFPYADLIDAFGIDISVIIVESEGMVSMGDKPVEDPPSVSPSVYDPSKNRPGAKVDSVRWEQFAAALAVLVDRDELDMSSETKAHKAVAEFLVLRGHDNALGVDTVRSLIRRFAAWKANHPFTDDHDYPAT